MRGFFAHLERKKYKLHVRVFLSRYRGYSPCSTCSGARLRTEARQVRLQARISARFVQYDGGTGRKFFAKMKLSRSRRRIAEQLLRGNSASGCAS